MAQVGRAGVAALAALLVVDVALVALAFRHVQGSSQVGAVQPGANGPSDPGKDPGGGSKPPSKKPPAKAPNARMLVDIASDDAVARAVAGVCGKGGGKVELSTDQGKSWKPAELENAEVILRIAATNADEISVVAADRSCERTTTYETTNGGGQWDDSEGSDKWHQLAGADAKAGRVHTPNGEADVQCADGDTVSALSTLSNDQAYAMCSDGTIKKTDDGGQSWENGGEVVGATDFDFVDSDIGLAVIPDKKPCKGVAVMKTEDGGEEWKQAGCAESKLAGGLPEISADGDRAYIARGQEVWFSDSGGTSWNPR